MTCHAALARCVDQSIVLHPFSCHIRVEAAPHLLHLALVPGLYPFEVVPD